MTKQFTTPCFIRKNTPELRDKLKEIGYNVATNAYRYHGLSVNCYSQNGNCFGLEVTACNIFFNPDIIDCGENEQLFLALAAMNDSDDKDQLFINDKYKDIGCTMYHIESTKKFNKYLVEWEDGLTDLRCDFRKATVPEIIEHFKTKEK